MKRVTTNVQKNNSEEMIFLAWKCHCYFQHSSSYNSQCCRVVQLGNSAVCKLK